MLLFRRMVSTVLWLSLTAMAVDRKKFRTCDKTSFCRRHRYAAASPFFDYQLIPESITFHHSDSDQEDTAEKDGAAAAAVEVEDQQQQDGGGGGGGGGVWQQIQRRLLGVGGAGAGSGDSKNGDDPYVLGPTPTLTGTLQNRAVTTSSATAELLTWSVTALEDGLIRMRMTEIYGGEEGSNAHAQPRVTYDELVLETPQTWRKAHHAALLQATNPENKAVQDLFRKLLEYSSSSSSTSREEQMQNHIALHYSDTTSDDLNQGHVLWVQLQPFAASLFRLEDLQAGPLVVLGADQQMHFEIRRFKPSESSEDEQQRRLSEENNNDNKEEPGEEKPEKEIVGYWEDGLAIYADGTREEKKPEPGDSDGETAETGRRLSEEEAIQAEMDTEGMWEESFDGHTDSKPYGPMSVGMDIQFPSSKHLYGLAEHASSLKLQNTVGDDAHYADPYRLYNLDVFEYELDVPMALYGHVPLVVSHSTQTGTVGAFWLNPTETFVDVEYKPSAAKTHWISESGIMDIFLLPGGSGGTKEKETASDATRALYRQYATLTGTTALPPMFSLGYHQCRWNYKDEKDVYAVHGKFEELDYPYDVLWLDIEHTDGKRYFTWDQKLFPNPDVMQKTLWDQGRRMVTIIDPHIKRDNNYYIHKEATNKGLYIKDKEGKDDYDGFCWPGQSSYLDFTDEKVRSWWADQFAYNRYKGSTPSLFTWNDMNEPSVFNGPEVSMQKDLRNLAGHEHREWHNLYGMLFHRATGEGQVRRNGPKQDVRPFVLSRAFFAGSQRYGAIWTGDNAANWEHLQIATPMLLSLNSAALSFVGADVGGFFGNPDAELFTRWMQAAAYQPFFRGHAHHDAKRREPWMFDDETLIRLRRAAMARYALLPLWYTLFYEAHVTGMPVMRAMWMEYPQTEALFAVDDQFLVGSDLLVKPVTHADTSEVTVQFPTDHIWYDAETLERIVTAGRTPNGVETRTVEADMDTLPVFQRGGSIVPRKLRLRRSTVAMRTDPYTLYVALDANGQATGQLYMDDEETFAYAREFAYGNCTFAVNLNTKKGTGTLTNQVTLGSGWIEQATMHAAEHMIERIVIMGLESAPPSRMSLTITGNDGTAEELVFAHDPVAQVMVIRKPSISALEEWTINLS